MKKSLTFFFMLLCAFSLTQTLSSCSDDDDDNKFIISRTKAERTREINLVAGNYTGKIYYTDATEGKQASEDVKWTITTDSVMTINELPMTIISGFITDENTQKILNDAAPQTFKMVYHPQYSYNDVHVYACSPTGNLSFTTVSDGVSHDVKITFLEMLSLSPIGSTENVFSLATFGQQDGRYTLQGNILLGTLTIDGNETALNYPLLFYGYK